MEGFKKSPKENIAETGFRWIRNFNLAVGALALAGALVTPVPALREGLIAYGLFNLAQAGLFEVARRFAGARTTKAKLKPA